MKPISVNYHLLRACNASCRFCFATFHDVRGRLRTGQAMAVVDALADAGCEKLNFAGGEPTLHPDLALLLGHAKCRGLVTSIVTNGFALDRLLVESADVLDWVGLSVDSASEETQALLGRGSGHVERAVELAGLCRDRGVRVKLNSVVTSLTWDEDMSRLVRRIRPERWKVFQVLPIRGQNEGSVEQLLISDEQFAGFVARHAHLEPEGLGPVVEDNDAMMGSYIMVDPLGRFFGNSTGRHVYSEPILSVGVEAALQQVGFEHEKFLGRGGRYSW